jgi:DGQHR domain-containing protein
MDYLKQNDNEVIIQTKKTVDWLVNNTIVLVFDPILFSGYQREIDTEHCKNIEEYIINSPFFFPTSIICACDEKYTDNSKLRIVDGQHRIKAFELIKTGNPEKYESIKNMELSVLILEKVMIEKEIETFININKKGKKVDTSLATVLKHIIADKEKLNKQNIRNEYISVEVGYNLNLEENGLWENQICFEGNAKKHNQLISINAFTRSTQFLLGNLNNYHIVNVDWNNQEELQKCKEDCTNIVKYIWQKVKEKWPELFTDTIGINSIIQGPIGYSSISKYIVFYLKEQELQNKSEFMNNFSAWLKHCSVNYTKWLPKGSYSNYSSEAGYTIIAKDLIDKMKK